MASCGSSSIPPQHGIESQLRGDIGAHEFQTAITNAPIGGEGEIRTHESREGPPVFKTGAFNRSATSPTL